MSKYNKENARHSECSGCGGTLQYNIVKSKFECTHCGNTQNVTLGHELEKNPFDFRNTIEEVPSDSTAIIGCKNCGAEIILDDEHDITGECPYCDTKYVTNFSEKRLIVPTALIPFSIPRDEAVEQFKKWAKKLKGEKKGFTNAVMDTNVVQTYRPFWVFDSEVYVDYMYSKTVREGKRTYSIDVKGNEKINLKDVGIDAMYLTQYTDHIDKHRQEFQKYDYNELVDYDDAFITGTETSVYIVDLGEGFDSTLALIGTAIAGMHGGPGRAWGYKISDAKDSLYSLALLPVWEARMVFEGETYVYSMNGQTGKQFGEYPRSWLFQKVDMR